MKGEPVGEAEHWLSFHAFYHGDRDLPLRHAVLPLVRELRDASLLESFFFIRYSLGGPHLRLRLLPEPGRGPQVRAMIRDRFERFFARFPSTESLDPDEIRRDDASILAHEGGDAKAEPPADNSLHEGPFEPETRRYGGPELLPFSLRLFQLSSCAALRFVDLAAELPRGKRLTAAARWLVRQAAAGSEGGEHFRRLLGYGTRWWQSWQPLLAKADAAYERSPAVYRQLLASSVFEPAAEPALAELERGAAGLVAALGGVEAPLRAHILESQLHMTANRLGLGNADEVYLSRLLARAAEDLHDGQEEPWLQVEQHLARTDTSPQALDAAARAALRCL